MKKLLFLILIFLCFNQGLAERISSPTICQELSLENKEKLSQVEAKIEQALKILNSLPTGKKACSFWSEHDQDNPDPEKRINVIILKEPENKEKTKEFIVPAMYDPLGNCLMFYSKAIKYPDFVWAIAITHELYHGQIDIEERKNKIIIFENQETAWQERVNQELRCWGITMQIWREIKSAYSNIAPQELISQPEIFKTLEKGLAIFQNWEKAGLETQGKEFEEWKNFVIPLI